MACAADSVRGGSLSPAASGAGSRIDRLNHPIIGWTDTGHLPRRPCMAPGVLTTDEAHSAMAQSAWCGIRRRVATAAAPTRTSRWHDLAPRNHGSIFPAASGCPDTGYGALAPVMQDIFRGRPGARQSGGDRGAIPWCSTAWQNCWMSWNAAKRAVALGYSPMWPGIATAPIAGKRMVFRPK